MASELGYRLLEKLRWPDGKPVCPRCGWHQCSYLAPQNGQRVTNRGRPTARRIWKCGRCRTQFSALVGTMMEGSHVAPETWMKAVGVLAERPELSVRALGAALGVNARTATRMRRALLGPASPGGRRRTN